MIKLSYSTFGLTKLELQTAIDEVDKIGYQGIELSFHRDQFNPFEITDEDITNIKRQFEKLKVKPVCIATASYFFSPDWPHEPSLMCPDLAGRKRRINLVKRGIEIAKALKVSLVTFGSGFIRNEHVTNPSINPNKLLLDSIRECLAEISEEDGITLMIEPEPGMFIDTLDQGIDLVNEINSPYFKLHLDLCHIYCSENDVISALEKATPYSRFLHVSDTNDGHNLKIVMVSDDLKVDLNFASYLVYFPENSNFLLLDKNNPTCFYDMLLTNKQKQQIEKIAGKENITKEITYVEYNNLYAGSTKFDNEIFTYIISIPGISFEVLDRAKPIINYLRESKNSDGDSLMDKMVANTFTNKVHFHEIPGEGNLDLEACFKALNDSGFSGYASVELYHHIDSWKKALEDSFKNLSNYAGITVTPN